MVKTRLIGLFILLLSLSPLHAAMGRSSVLSPAPGRETISLDGEWRAAIDADAQAPAAIWARELPSTLTLPVPGAWSAHPQTADCRGAVWYQRDVTVPAKVSGSDALLVIGNPVGMLEVYYDGISIGSFVGNGLTRRIRVKAAADSTHRLALRLSRVGLPPSIPAFACGLSSVSLILLPPTRVEELLVTIDPVRQRLTARYRINVEATTATLRFDLYPPDASRALTTAAIPITGTQGPLEGEWSYTIKKLQYWSPRDRHLYRVRASLTTTLRTLDSREMRCGASNVTLRGNEVQLNHTVILLKGLRLSGHGMHLAHEQALNSYGSEFKLARQAGFNAVMSDGLALPEEALAKADELGLLVVGDIPVGNTMRPEMQAIVEAYAGHPCVAMWSWDQSTGGETGIADLRAVDAYRMAIVRNGEQGQVIPTESTAPYPIVNLDATLTAPTTSAWWERMRALESNSLPVFVSGIGVNPPAEAADNPDTENGEQPLVFRNRKLEAQAALNELREIIETLRSARAYSLLGYFVRLPQLESICGLQGKDCTPLGIVIAGQAFNQACLLAVRDHQPVTPGTLPNYSVVIVNDAHYTGVYQLSLILTSLLDGETSIDGREVFLIDKRLLEEVAANAYTHLISGKADKPGTYRMQLVLTHGNMVVSTTRMIEFTVSEPTAPEPSVPLDE